MIKNRLFKGIMVVLLVFTIVANPVLTMAQTPDIIAENIANEEYTPYEATTDPAEPDYSDEIDTGSNPGGVEPSDEATNEENDITNENEADGLPALYLPSSVNKAIIPIFQSTTLNESPYLEIIKSVSSDTASIGDDITYTIVITNIGTATLTDVEVTTAIDADLTDPRNINISVAPGNFINLPGTASFAGQFLTWDVETLFAGDSLSLSFDVTVAATAENGSIITNTAYAHFTPCSGVGISVQLTATDHFFFAGDIILFRLQIENVGGIDAQNVVVYLPLYEYLLNPTVVNVSVGSVSFIDSLLTWDIGFVEVGAFETLYFETLLCFTSTSHIIHLLAWAIHDGSNPAPVTVSGSVSVAIVSETPTTEPPTTESPTTETSTTETSTTETPTTEAPTTESPTTETLTTEAPTTESPTTETPTTEIPTTEASTTESSTTESPTTETPTTEAPTAETPTTESPTTESSTAESPTIETPTTEASTTEASATEAPAITIPTTTTTPYIPLPPATPQPTYPPNNDISDITENDDSYPPTNDDKVSANDANNDNNAAISPAITIPNEPPEPPNLSDEANLLLAATAMPWLLPQTGLSSSFIPMLAMLCVALFAAFISIKAIQREKTTRT